MDGDRFDDLTRQLARTTSRRRAVGTIVVGAAGALRYRRAPAASAQAGSCAGKASGQSCGECGTCLELPASGALECVALTFMCRGGGRPDDAACVHCDPATFTCRPPQECGPCEKCFASGAAGTGCTYVAKGRDGQCDREMNPCDPETGKCRCARDRTWCDPECVDVQTDPRHCGSCDHPCGTCEHCREGRCVPCDEECERCDEERGCVSTCEDRCKTCLDGRCVKPDPPICVCEAEDNGAPPTAKRIYLPVVAAAGTDTTAVEPCGEGDRAQCCAPGACCGAGATAHCCGQDQTCCGVVCCASHECCGGNCCAEDESCCGSTCCPAGQDCCDGECKETCDDPCGPGYQTCELRPELRPYCCPAGSPCCPGNSLAPDPCQVSFGACCPLGTHQCEHLCCAEDELCDYGRDPDRTQPVCCPQGQDPCAGQCCPVGLTCYPDGASESCREHF